MNLTNLLSRRPGDGAAPRENAGAVREAIGNPAAPEGVSTRIGDVVIAASVANDLSAPANDVGRPHILAQRMARAERRHLRRL